MRRPSGKRILAGRAAADFIGRADELARLIDHAKGGSNGLALLAVPFAGASELLRQAYDRLFFEQEDVIPFYFELKASDANSRNAALRFLREFLLQTVAFRRHDASIIAVQPEICEISDLAVPFDGQWIGKLIETCNSDSRLNEDRSFVRNCLSAPVRAAAHGSRAFVMIDDLHVTAEIDGGAMFFDDLGDILRRATIPFVFAGQRRFIFSRTSLDNINVAPFSLKTAGELVEHTSARTGVRINDQTRDLIAIQLGGNAGHIASLFASAAAKSNDLNSFELVQRAYTDEVFGGRIGRYFDAVLACILPDAGSHAAVLRLMSETMAARENMVPAAYWKKHVQLSDAKFNALNCYEILSLSSGSVEVDGANIVLCDYIRSRAALEIDGTPRALAVGVMLSENVKRAPDLMARSYRKGSAIGLRELMGSFDGRPVSPALLDYGRFRDEFKGSEDDRILRALRADNAKIDLPRVVYAAHTAAFDGNFDELCDAERSAIALGFSDAADKDEVAWLAVEIDSKLEATLELAETWYGHLEKAALNCNFSQFKIWIVAPEGFAPDAMDFLREKQVYSSSRKQADLLAGILNLDVRAAASIVPNEYEIVVPMGEDAEMIAAHTVEEIARRHKVPAKAINQIKTALVEACINASEHSLSPDRRIYQKFSVDAGKITVTVANRGLRLVDKKTAGAAPDEGRRGWGLKLIQGLMDEVTVEQTDDGTRITMVKHFEPV